ncbi:ABC transporter ATP-binding protein [Notoacmeibacter sp. MSK16QG-6]|uniref:ABC transporter ATP-binding protein n=1 Tax=Notoacmeibacter sp. MSK16QG-6 TaxID=2957982 RepID=UPI0020A192DD|nr:ABC transporter ATP-binding protein [Notoacmeibacter sp. MSK16QG-6]MCP1199391.1 ABC transporter ATP-binding protein [Notoacmeibacter sp. MSK16QG-6]
MSLPQKQPDSPQTSVGVSFAARLGFEHIHHAYDDKPVLKDISLVAEAGEVLCLLGPSGSGKSTLLRIAAGIEPQQDGRILLNDREIAGPSVFVPPEKRSIGLVFQDFALFPHLTLLENTRFGLTELSRKDGLAEARIALSRVGLGDKMNAYPHELSGGQQQRVALARALAPRPAVLLMDEPFSGLDSRLKDAVRAETLAILRQSRTTAVIVTHDAEEAMRIADRIALLKDGRVVQVGTAQELYHQPVDLFTARFFSEVNIFPGTVEEGAVETPVGRIEAPGFVTGATVKVAVRLVGIEVSTEEGEIEARIVRRRFLGVTEVLELAVSGAERTVRATVREGHLPPGVKNVRLSLRLSDVLVFASSSN